jgi:glycerol-3-phosphate dehydrogenase
MDEAGCAACAAVLLQVTLLLRDPYLCKDINELHCNTRYLKVRDRGTAAATQTPLRSLVGSG